MSDDQPDWCRCGNFAVLGQNFLDGRWWCECIRCEAGVIADTKAVALRMWNEQHGDSAPHPRDQKERT